MIDGLNMWQVLHPMVVHFPIAFLSAAVLFELLWLIRGAETFRTMAAWMIHLGAAGAVAAVGAGYLAAGLLGHDAPGHELVHEHRNAMLILTSGLIVTAAGLFFSPAFREGSGRRFLIAVLIILTGIMAFGADKGGRLVYQHGVGVQAASLESGTFMGPDGHAGRLPMTHPGVVHGQGEGEPDHHQDTDHGH